MKTYDEFDTQCLSKLFGVLVSKRLTISGVPEAEQKGYLHCLEEIEDELRLLHNLSRNHQSL